MLGFKVSINGEEACTASASTVASVIATVRGAKAICGAEPPSLTVNGITAPFTHTTWHQDPVLLGDIITIEIVDIPETANSQPIEVRKISG